MVLLLESAKEEDGKSRPCNLPTQARSYSMAQHTLINYYAPGGPYA